MGNEKGSKKKRARNMRTSSYMEGGKRVSHKMAWVGDPTKKKGKYGVFPTVTPKKGKESSTKKSDWTTQTPGEAHSKGEMIEFSRRNRAERFSAGSWKKGKEKREAMKTYRRSKK
jgi:hypothetical protein